MTPMPVFIAAAALRRCFTPALFWPAGAATQT
jgi:hypothetical protein